MADRAGRAPQTRVAKIRALPKEPLPLPQIVREKWPVDFVDAWRNRIRVGTMRYHPGASQYESLETGDSFLRRLKEKLDTFERTRNHEMLVDIAVYCGLIWQFDDNPRAHFQALDKGIDR